MSNTINLNYAYNLIVSAKNKTFTATYIKSDGSTRIINCRLNVKVGTNGGGLKYNPIEKGLIPVFDMQLRKKGLPEKDCFRMLNFTTIKKLVIDHKEYKAK